jgi:hypothetical protein
MQAWCWHWLWRLGAWRLVRRPKPKPKPKWQVASASCASASAGNKQLVQGAAKQTKNQVVGGWVRGQKRTRVRFIFSVLFFRAFELSSTRNAQKRIKKKIERKSVLDFWSVLFP